MYYVGELQMQAHSDHVLLVPRVQITTYNLHVLGAFPPSLGLLERTKSNRRFGADTVI